MSGQGKNLPAAGSNANNDLEPGFTFEEWKRDIFDELDKSLGDILPERLPGDIDINDLMDYYFDRQGKRIHPNTARNRLRKLGDKPGWQLIKVYDANSTHNNKVITVARKLSGE